ncbi:MAG: transcriptional regulator [Methanosarcinales archaeon]|nr:MAG: transcriptional regulator [Methanosarcinales archaeon]
MTKEELKKLLDELRTYPAETEWIEFKEAKASFSFKELGQYFSALSNEANLKNQSYGWLVFGVADKTRKIVGTSYRTNRANLDSLKSEVANKTTNRITFIEIRELYLPEGRVIMFQIPSAPKGIPIAWEGHYYGRDGESLGALNLQEIEQIRGQVIQEDWSAKICEEATVDDLEGEAISVAKEKFKAKNKNRAFVSEIDTWDTITFLDKAKITINGGITNAAIILLGKPESTHFISPAVARITWKLEDIENDYEHFDPPFYLNINRVYRKIRNIKYKILPENTLLPTEVTRYEQWVILEALNNCIAHQDYSLRSRIIVTERPGELIFINAGSFFEGTVEDYTLGSKTPERYRNYFLSQAMNNLGMIDTVGHGIKKMFVLQRQRHFPLPEYDFSAPKKVSLKIYGHIIDENYTKLLMEKADLDLRTTMLLDKVQKRQTITREAFTFLKKNRLVEGRYPNIYVASQVAAVTGDKSGYIKHRAFDKKYYKAMVMDLIREFGSASREDIDRLIISKLPDVLDKKQKKNKVSNLLYEMSKKDGVIKNTGSDKKPCWVLA